MASSDDIKEDVQSIINTQWDKRNGQKVPETDDITLSGGAVELDATYLYTDLADSSKIAKLLDRRVAAKIIKSFLLTSCRLISANDGNIISFDGDRVLGVFYGGSKNTNAARTSLNIKYAVTEVIRPKFESSYKTVKESNILINHGTGVDTGKVLIVRAGVRGSNDLVSIGRGPNIAAKLSDIRETTSYCSYITASVYNSMNESVTYSNSTDENMWERRTWDSNGEKIKVYRSSWWRKP